MPKFLSDALPHPLQTLPYAHQSIDDQYAHQESFLASSCSSSARHAVLLCVVCLLPSLYYGTRGVRIRMKLMPRLISSTPCRDALQCDDVLSADIALLFPSSNLVVAQLLLVV